MQEMIKTLHGHGIKIQKIPLYGVKLLSIYRRTFRTSCMYACKKCKRGIEK